MKLRWEMVGLALMLLAPPPVSARTSLPSTTLHDTAVVGCSNTDRAVNEYVNGRAHRRFGIPWETEGHFTKVSLGGGTVDRWATNSRGHWDNFTSQLHPGITQVWWQMCVQFDTPDMDDGDVADMDAAYAFINNALTDAGLDVPIYISALNSYDPGMPRYAAWVRTVQMVEYALGNYVLAEGPIMPKLDSTMVISDGIHPNEAGKIVLSETLKAFFDIK